MYSVSQNFKNAIMSTSRILKAKVLINSREYDESYIVEMNYEDTSNPSGSFEIGTVASATLNISVVGVNEAFETATIKPYIGLDLNGTVEYVPLGVFYCDQVERKKDVVTLTCYDGMIKLEKAYFSDLTYPATITAVMNEICNKTGIQFVGTLPNYQIQTKPEGYTYREVVAFIAQMCGGFAKFDRDGKLRIKSYTTTSETITADHYMDDGFSKKKDDVFRIDKITCQVGENTISKGTLSAGGSEVQFENPFMTDAIMTDVYNKLKGFQYLPVYLKFVGNPAYEVGDIVTLVTVDDETIQIPIMVNKLAFSGGLTGEIESVGETENSNQFDSSGSLTNKVERVVYELAFINEALINKATIEDLEATNARIDDLIANDLAAINAAIENLQADKANITDLEAVNAAIENLQATKADIEDLNATNARIDNLEATKANITDLDSINAAIQNLQAEKANITDLNAANARIDNLVANDLTAINAEITNLKAGKADITDLNAVNATIATLQADVGSINTLLAGNLGAENFRAGAIYAGSGVIAQGAIGDAEISNLNASKINAGILNTALVTIQGANGRLKMSGNRLQVFANKSDGSLYERVSLGDVNGDGSVYGLRVRGADGQTVLLDENGVTREGITDGSITNEKIADDANISGSKLDIASVVTEINEGTTTIQSSKIFYNGKTLDVQLGSMSDTITSQGQTITNHETRITATEQGLATKVSVSQYQQDQAALSSQLSQMSTQIQQQADQIALKADAANVYTKSQIDGQFTTVNTQISNLSAQLSVQADQIATKVSRTEFESLQIGGRNLIIEKKITHGYYVDDSGNLTAFQNAFVTDFIDIQGASSIAVSTNGRNNVKRVAFYDQNKVFIPPRFLDTSSKTSVIVPVPSNAKYVRFSSDNFASGYFKLEKGNRATDWTPAPEDTQSQIDGLGTRLSTAETSITQLSNQIQLKANQTTVDTLTNRISQAESTLTIHTNQIATKVSQTELQTAIDGIQVGGRNLARQTDFSVLPSSWQFRGNYNGVIDTSNTYQGHNSIKITTNGAGTDGTNDFVVWLRGVLPAVGDNYTISFYAKAQTGGGKVFARWGANGSSNRVITDQSLTTNWQKFVINLTISSVTTGDGAVVMHFTTDDIINIALFKIEKGNKATDWTPAPEDVQGQIDGLGTRVTNAETSITQLSNQIQLKANQTTVDTLANRISSAESTINLLSDEIDLKVNKDGVISAINQTAEQIKIQASKVDLSGYVTFTNLSTPGQTTIDGGNITSGYISADRIAAGSITSEKLVIGDFTNLCENPDFEGDAVGSSPKGYVQTSLARVADISGFANGNGSNRALEIDARNGVNNDVYASNIFPVRPGQQFFIEAEARYLNTAGTGYLRIGFRRYDDKKTALNAWHGVVRWDGTKVTSFTRKSGTFTVPSGTGYLQIWISFYNNGETTNKAYIDNIRVHRMAAGELIVDGSITTTKLAAKSITADKLNVTTLSAISADLGTVTAGTLKGVKLEGALIDATTGLTVYHLSMSANGYPNLAIYGEPNVGAFTIRTADGIDSAHAASLNIVADGNLRLGGSTVSINAGLDVSSDIEFSGAKGRLFTDAGANVGYLQTTGNEYRVTKYKSTTYIPIRASSFPTSSLAENKLDIHVWEESALELIRNATIYEYRTKWEDEQGIFRWRQGLVVGEGYNTPSGVIDGPGVEQYLMNAWSWKAIQELDTEQQSMKDRIAWLELENQYLKQKIQQLEAMVS